MRVPRMCALSKKQKKKKRFGIGFFAFVLIIRFIIEILSRLIVFVCLLSSFVRCAAADIHNIPSHFSVFYEKIFCERFISNHIDSGVS